MVEHELVASFGLQRFLFILPVCKLEFLLTLSLKINRSVAYQLLIKLGSFYFPFWLWICYNVAGVWAKPAVSVDCQLFLVLCLNSNGLINQRLRFFVNISWWLSVKVSSHSIPLYFASFFQLGIAAGIRRPLVEYYSLSNIGFSVYRHRVTKSRTIFNLFIRRPLSRYSCVIGMFSAGICFWIVELDS